MARLRGDTRLLCAHDALAQLDVGVVLAVVVRHDVVGLAQTLALEHALVVPAADAQRGQAADDVGDDVVEVEVAAVGQEALQELRADAKAECAHDEGEVQGAPAVGIGDPVEDDGQDEEGKEVEDFVVDQDVDLEACEAGVACEKEEQEEDSCRVRRAKLGPNYQRHDFQIVVEEEVVVVVVTAGGWWVGRCVRSLGCDPGLDVPANGSRILMMKGRYVR